MKHIPIRLGPLALLLTVISICMTTLGILAFTTARADMSLAEKYASTVRNRYILEKEGQYFLRQAEEALKSGSPLEEMDGAETDEGGRVYRTFECEDFRLRVGILQEDERTFRVTEWRIQKDWEPGGSMLDLWDGE